MAGRETARHSEPPDVVFFGGEEAVKPASDTVSSSNLQFIGNTQIKYMLHDTIGSQPTKSRL